MSWFLPADERIETERLALDPLTVDDAAEMVPVLADPALYTVIGGTPPTLTVLRERYRQLAVGHSQDGSEQWLNWIVRLGGDQATAVGTVQATILPPGTGAEVAWVIGTGWQGRGLGSEAAAAMVGWLGQAGVRSVVAHIHPDHRASRAVAGRAGLAPTDQFVDGEQRWVSPAG